MKKPNANSLRGSAVQLGLVALLAALLAFLFGSGLSLWPRHLAPKNLSSQNAVMRDVVFQNGGFTLSAGGGELLFFGVDEPSVTVAVTAKSDADAPFPVKVSAYLLTDEAQVAGEELCDEAFLVPNGAHSTAVLQLRSHGRLQSFKLIFSGAVGEVVVTEVVLNQSGLAFNWALFALLFLAGAAGWAVLKYGWWRAGYQPGKKSHRRLVAAAVALCCAGCLFLLWATTLPLPAEGDGHFLVNAAPDATAWGTQYVHLFDALKNGQLAVRTPPDPALATLPNPYDPTQRAGIDYIWDMAYFNGQYYCYFGPAPMPLYFLVYGLTGMLPGMALAAFVPALLAVLLLWPALKALLRYFNTQANLLLLLLGLPAVCAGALLYMLQSCADGYVQPYLWAAAGVLGLTAALYGALAPPALIGSGPGPGKLRKFRQPLLFFAAGLCVVLVAAARPQQLLLCLALALPPLLRFWRGKKGTRHTPRQRLVCTAALALPVGAGAALLMAYNAARFGSAFSFGNEYQLTVGDMRWQQFSPNPALLLEALRHYLFYPLKSLPAFPFVRMNGFEVTHFGNRFYNYISMGLLNLPLFWALPAPAATLKKRDGVQKALVLGGFCAAAFVLWFNWCTSHALYRYICDVSVLLGLLCLWGLAQIRPAGAGKAQKWLYAAVVALLLGSLVVGGLLCFSNERDYILARSPDVYLFFSRMLRFR